MKFNAIRRSFPVLAPPLKSRGRSFLSEGKERGSFRNLLYLFFFSKLRNMCRAFKAQAMQTKKKKLDLAKGNKTSRFSIYIDIFCGVGVSQSTRSTSVIANNDNPVSQPSSRTDP